MEQINKYIATAGSDSAPDVNTVEELIAKYPWCSVLRSIKSHLTGTSDRADELLRLYRGATLFEHQPIDIATLSAVTEGELIDRFLRQEDLRIVVEEDTPEGDVMIEPDLSYEDDLVSEELAEVYLSQGLRAEAIEIYRKLSLLNTEKFAYFAEKIEKIENN